MRSPNATCRNLRQYRARARLRVRIPMACAGRVPKRQRVKTTRSVRAIGEKRPLQRGTEAAPGCHLSLPEHCMDPRYVRAGFRAPVARRPLVVVAEDDPQMRALV